MHAIDRLAWVLDLARELGYEVRHEWLGGARGGCCEIKGRRILFVDVSAGTLEQLDQIVESLQRDPQIYQLRLTHDQRDTLGLCRAA